MWPVINSIPLIGWNYSIQISTNESTWIYNRSCAYYLRLIECLKNSRVISFWNFGFRPLFWLKKPTSENRVEKWLKKARILTPLFFKHSTSQNIMVMWFITRLIIKSYRRKKPWLIFFWGWNRFENTFEITKPLRKCSKNCKTSLDSNSAAVISGLQPLLFWEVNSFSISWPVIEKENKSENFAFWPMSKNL